MTNPKDLINYGELSRLLTDSRMNIRRNRIPKKYEADIARLIAAVDEWVESVGK